jgi:hypothetical protein
MHQLAPLGALGELQGAGARRQLAGVAAVGSRGPGDKQQQEKKTLWPAPQGFALRMQLAWA